MRSISVRALESTPGPFYCRRAEPRIIKTRKGRLSGGSLPFSSFGIIVVPAFVLFVCSVFGPRTADVW